MAEPTHSDIGRTVRWTEPAPITGRPIEYRGTLSRLPTSEYRHLKLAVVWLEKWGQRFPVNVYPADLEVVDDDG